MLDIKFIRENKALVKENVKNRRAKVDVDDLLKLDEHRREKLSKLEELRAMRNKKSKGKPSDEDIAKMREVGEQIKELEQAVNILESEYREMLYRVPNLSHADAPVGGEEAYKVLFETKKPKPASFEPKDHETLMTNLGMIDFERGAKVAGSKFYFSRGDLVRLNNALIQYGIEVATRHGYELMETPDMVKNDILDGSGFNPRGEESQIYEIKDADMSLIGTAEITVLGYHANEVLDLSKGPKKYVALSHCFRTEGGAYGRVSKGLYRVHQFTKLEMFVFCKPSESEYIHQELLAIEQEICDGLKLTYRVIDTPTGELGGPAYRKYDIEAWMVMNGSTGSPQGGYGEITSASNCTDYQARRLNIKYKKEDGAGEYVHTLNGTAIVSTRFPVAIVEQYQRKDGTIEVPKVLRDYMGKKYIGA